MSSTTTSISDLLKQLEATNDPSVAYFSYTADDKGERGVIHANKEGLRLYALDLLKKSVQMEALQDGKNLCFKDCEWLISDTGYNLISAVKPAYKNRDAILQELSGAKESAPGNITPDQSRTKGCLGTLLVLIGCLFTIGAAIKCFS